MSLVAAARMLRAVGVVAGWAALVALGWRAVSPADGPGFVRAVAVSADGQTVYLATGQVLLRSTDGGARWEQVLPRSGRSAAAEGGKR